MTSKDSRRRLSEVLGQLWVLTVVVAMQIYVSDKMTQNYTHQKTTKKDM